MALQPFPDLWTAHLLMLPVLGIMINLKIADDVPVNMDCQHNSNQSYSFSFYQQTLDSHPANEMSELLIYTTN